MARHCIGGFGRTEWGNRSRHARGSRTRSRLSRGFATSGRVHHMPRGESISRHTMAVKEPDAAAAVKEALVSVRARQPRSVPCGSAARQDTRRGLPWLRCWSMMILLGGEELFGDRMREEAAGKDVEHSPAAGKANQRTTTIVFTSDSGGLSAIRRTMYTPGPRTWSSVELRSQLTVWIPEWKAWSVTVDTRRPRGS